MIVFVVRGHSAVTVCKHALGGGDGFGVGSASEKREHDRRIAGDCRAGCGRACKTRISAAGLGGQKTAPIVSDIVISGNITVFCAVRERLNICARIISGENRISILKIRRIKSGVSRTAVVTGVVSAGAD